MPRVHEHVEGEVPRCGESRGGMWKRSQGRRSPERGVTSVKQKGTWE